MRTRGGLCLVLLACAIAPANGQPPAKRGELPPPSDYDKPAASEGPEILPPEFAGDLCPGVPLCLIDALRLAAMANLDIAQANLAVDRARAAVLRIKASYLPSLNLGSTYTAHDGTIQRTEGNVIRTDRDSLFVGLTTSLNVNFADAFFLPKEAEWLLQAASVGTVRVTNDTLLRVADAYFELLRARRRLARTDEALDFLTSEKDSDLRGGSQGLLPLIRAFVKSGTALPSDQARVEVDVARATEERVRALQDVRVAAAELARLLHMNALVFLLPKEDFRWPLDIPGPLWCKQPIDALVTQALTNRPELAENAALIEAAVARYRATKWRPLVPSLVVNYSYGGFGGGPEVVRRNPTTGAIATTPFSNGLSNSGVIADFGSRNDLDVGLVWRLNGLGLGNYAEQRDAKLRVEQGHLRRMFLQDLVVTQVVQSIEQVQRSHQRVAATRAALFDELGRPTGAVYRSLRLNFLRIRGGQGLPLEVLDSVRRLGDLLESYGNALTDYDRARFRLLVALGLPPAALLDPKRIPLPPGCPPPVNPPATAGVNNQKDEKPPSGLDRKADPPRNEGATLAPELPPPRPLPDDGLQFVTPPRKD